MHVSPLWRLEPGPRVTGVGAQVPAVTSHYIICMGTSSLPAHGAACWWQPIIKRSEHAPLLAQS